MDDQDGCIDTGVIPNDRLTRRLHAKGLSRGRFATAVGVDVKTVRRWLANTDYNVRDDNARRAADVLGCTPHDLWPNQFQPFTARALRRQGRPFTPTLYPTRTQLPITAGNSISPTRTTGRHPGLAGDILVRHCSTDFVDSLVDAAPTVASKCES